MGSSGPVSVTHTSSGELTNGTFVCYPILMESCNALSNNRVRTGSPGRVGRKRLCHTTDNSVLSDSDVDANEDNSVMEWSRGAGQHNSEEKTERHITSLVVPGSNNKFRIVTNEDKVVSNTPVKVTRFDDSPDGVMLEMDANERQSPLEYGTEEISDFGVNCGKLTLWQFLLELLLSNKYHNLIRWTNKKGEFILLQAEAVAKLWGLYKDRNHRMNYDKLSRALRYYYEKNIIRKVHGHKFVYQFIGLRNLIKMCQDATNNAVPPRSFELITDCCSSIDTKTHEDWELPTSAALNLDRLSPCIYTLNDLHDSPNCTTAAININNNTSMMNGNGFTLYSQSGLVQPKSITRDPSRLTLDGLIERWPVETHAEKTNISSSTAPSTIPGRCSPPSDEVGLLRDKHHVTAESTDLQSTVSVDNNLNSITNTTQRANDFSSLLCSLASFMSAGHWIPRLAEQNPPDPQPPFTLSTSSTENVVSKPASTNFLLNPIPGPMWMAQMMNTSREPFNSVEFSPENDVTRSKLPRSDSYSSMTHQTSKSPILLDTSANLCGFPLLRDRGFGEFNTPSFQFASQTEPVLLERRTDSSVRSASPDCHCSCHTLLHTKSIDWSVRKPHSTSDQVNIHTNESTANKNNYLVHGDAAKDCISSPPVQKDPSISRSNFPSNLVCETSPTQLHHQRHAINMQRLGEQLCRISRNQSNPIVTSSQPGTTTTTLPLGTSYIPSGISSASLPTARVQPIGRKDTELDSKNAGNLFECGNDTTPRIPSSSSPSSSFANGCLRNDEPCVWMPVPVTMLTSWIKLLSGMTTTNPPLNVPDADPGDCPSHKGLHCFRRKEPEHNDRLGLIQSHMCPVSAGLEPFASLKTEQRDSDHFVGI